MSTYNGPGTYYIINEATQTAVDLYLGGSAAGTAINGWQTSYDNNTHQIWLLADAGRGQVLILNQGTGTFVTAPQNLQPGGANPTPNTLASVVGDPGAPNDLYKRWIVQPQSNGNVAFLSVAYPGKVLDLDNSGTANGTPVFAWGDHQGNNQRWKLVPYFG
ncbi:carbohydrate-binding module family 13 protein [Hyaloscypha variabilis F]|uniref:Carbohydrate-binding module family 13 protein n=1 Tax=Hyaloscypha variabilis (strain UAMH 11265 / GT02V1 / F) TaxID=1149755 RepID=A0A2J6QTU4_HYAVF|nr:carbohydrate-binding module family 13 protein [Hyaloscypha variabilis F]